MFKHIILSVVACVTGIIAATAQTAYTLPFRLKATDPLASEVEMLDCNHDGDEFGTGSGKWTLDKKKGCFRYLRSANNADDWLMLPVIDFGGAETVKVTINVLTGPNNQTESLEICLGQNRMPESMTKSVWYRLDFSTNNEQLTSSGCESGLPASSDDNKWAIGIHAFSSALRGYIEVYEIIVEDAHCPQPPTLKEHTLDVSTFTATLTMPDTNLGSATLTEPLTLEVSDDDGVVATMTDCTPGADVEFKHYFRPNNVPYNLKFRAVSPGNNKKSEPADAECSIKVDYLKLTLPVKLKPSPDIFPQCGALDYSREDWSYTAEKEGAFMFAPKETEEGWFYTPAIDLSKSRKVRVYADILTEGPVDDFKICVGSSPSVSSMDLVAVQETALDTGGKYVTLSGEVELPEGVKSNPQSCVIFYVKSQGNPLYIRSLKVDDIEYAIPISVSFTKGYDTKCEIIDVNGDGNPSASNPLGIWKFHKEAVQPYFLYQSPSDNKADDWLILPMMEFWEARRVKVSVHVYNETNFPARMELKLGQNRTADGMTVEATDNKVFDIQPWEGKVVTATFELPEHANGTTWALGIHAISDGNGSKLRIPYDGVVIEDLDNTPAPCAPMLVSSKVEDFVYTASVQMPIKDVINRKIEKKMSLVAYVDGEPIATKTDLVRLEVVEISFLVPTGKHQVSFKAVLDNVESEAMTDDVTVSTTAYTLPAVFNATEETFKECVVIDVNNDGHLDGNVVKGRWNNSKLTYGPVFEYHMNQSTLTDDWVMLPYVDFGNVRNIKVSLDVWTMSNPHDLGVYLGQRRTIEGMNVEVFKVTELKVEQPWRTFAYVVTLPQPAAALPGQVSRSAANNYWSVGIHTDSKYVTNDLYIRNIKVESADPTSDVDDVATDGSVAPVEYFNLQGMRIENPEAGTLVIERNGNQVVKRVIR